MSLFHLQPVLDASTQFGLTTELARVYHVRISFIHLAALLSGCDHINGIISHRTWFKLIVLQ